MSTTTDADSPPAAPRRLLRFRIGSLMAGVAALATLFGLGAALVEVGGVDGPYLAVACALPVALFGLVAGAWRRHSVSGSMAIVAINSLVATLTVTLADLLDESFGVHFGMMAALTVGGVVPMMLKRSVAEQLDEGPARRRALAAAALLFSAGLAIALTFVYSFVFLFWVAQVL